MSYQVVRLQWLTGEEKIPLEAVFQPVEFLKEKNVSPERIKAWDEIQKQKRIKQNN